MAVYTRQYTQGVGWENEPSINTPISAENLNQMDNAALDIDAAVKSAFDSVETSLANAGGVSMGNKITSFSTTYNSMETDIAFDDSIANHDGAVFFLTSDDEGAENQNGWKIRVNWVNGSSTAVTRLPVLNVSPQTMSDVFTDAVAEGDVVIARLVIEDPADSSTWRCDLLAHISASANGGGIGAECSGHAITGLAGDNEAINAGILFDDDIINHDTHIFFLTSEYAVPEKSDAPYYWRLWVRYKMGSTTVGQRIMIYDIAGNAFDDAIPVGNEFICQLHLVDPSDSTTWYVSELANISAGGGGGSSTLAGLTDTTITSPADKQILRYDNTTSKWINGKNSANAFILNTGTTDHTGYTIDVDGSLATVEVGDIVEIQINANYTFQPSSGAVYLSRAWGLIASGWAANNVLQQVAVTEQYTDFKKNLKKGDSILTVCTGFYGMNLWPQLLVVAIYNADGTALGDLNNVDISTPTDGQYLKYDSTSSKWVNASGGGGGGSSTLAELDDTTISSPTDAQPLTYDATNSKWVNGGVIQTANGGTGNADGYIRTGKKANTTIGTGATIEGSNNEASANYTHAEGYNVKASTQNAHAEGQSTTASGNSAHAEGYGNTASGQGAHAEGQSNTASGLASHVEGMANTALARSTHVQGESCTASASYASAGGHGVTAGYESQFAVGKYNDNKSTSIFEVGIGTANNAKANGLELDTSGNLKTAGTITDGQGHVLGQAVVADGVWVISGETATLTVTTP